MMALLWQNILKAAIALLSCPTVMAQMQATAHSMGAPSSPSLLAQGLAWIISTSEWGQQGKAPVLQSTPQERAVRMLIQAQASKDGC